MLTITKRMQTMQREVQQLILLLKEGINLLKEISQSTESSPEKKLDYLRYLFLYYKRLQVFRNNVLELKPEVLIIEQNLEALLENGEKCYQQVKKNMEEMLNEIQRLPI